MDWEYPGSVMRPVKEIPTYIKLSYFNGRLTQRYKHYFKNKPNYILELHNNFELTHGFNKLQQKDN